MEEGYNAVIPNDEGLYCFACNETLVSNKVFMSYLTGSFPTQLLTCPKCGLVYIDEETVLNKAVEVERTMEEK